MTTATQVISEALAHIKVRGAGQSVDGTEAQDVLGVLNTMLDAWRLESLLAYATQTITGTLPASTQSLDIGDTEDLDIALRPVRFEAGSFYTLDDVDYPLREVTEAEYNAIATKDTEASGPEVFFYQPAAPVGTVYFYPRAAAAVEVNLIAAVEVSQFANLTTDYALAPGYKRAMSWSLAAELPGMFEVPPALLAIVMRNAANAKALIKRANHRVPQLAFEVGY